MLPPKAAGRNRAVAPGFGARHPEDSGKRPQRYLDVRRELGGHPAQVEVEVAHLPLGKLIGELSELERAWQVPIGPVGTRNYSVDANLQNVTWFGAFDVNRTGDGMRAPAWIVHPQLGDLLDADSRKNLVGGRHHRFHHHRIAGLNGEHGRLCVIEPSPLGGVRRCRKYVDPPHQLLPRALLQQRESLDVAR